MARVFRWRVLAKRPFTAREVDLILGGESLMKLATLMWESRRKPFTILVCLSWIALNLLAQGTVAMLSLNYSMDSGTDSTGIYTTKGTVNTPKLDCYFEKGECPDLPAAQMTTAHTYGELIRDQKSCTYASDVDIVHADQSCSYFRNQNNEEFTYHYSDYNPGDLPQAYPYKTYRNIRASASHCYQYNIDWAHSPLVDGTDGLRDTQVFSFSNETYTGHLPIPRSVGAYNSTTYIYNGSLIPQDAFKQACGPRCLTIYAYRLPSFRDSHVANIFSCQITVSDVYNATEDWHHLSNDNARLAAASIALTGRVTRPKGQDTPEWRQYQLYTMGSYWEATNRTAHDIGATIAEFTLGSLASMANLNPKELRPGTIPILGYRLHAQWNFIIALAVSIGFGHCLLVAIMLWVSRPIIVLDDSDLATARLLQGLVRKLDGNGSLLDGKELAEEIQSSSGSKKGKIVYGIGKRRDESGELVLDMREGLRLRQDLNGKKFPEGRYA